MSVTGAWESRYDQGGLAIFFAPRRGWSGGGGDEYRAGKGTKWVKTGIEMENGAPQLGTVATDAFSDWSLSPVPSLASSSSSSFLSEAVGVVTGMKRATTASFLIERNGTDLWVYHVTKQRGQPQRYPLREVTWAFLDERGKANAELWVGVYAAKPTYTEGRPGEKLSVEFRDLRIEC